MSSQIIPFFIQIAPIALGAIFVLVFKQVKFPEAGIQVRFSGEIPEEGTGCSSEKGASTHESVESPQEITPKTHLFEDMHAFAFESLVHDELIANGLFKSRGRPPDTNKIAFEALGILDERKAGDLRDYLKRLKRNRVRFFACGSPALHRRALSYTGDYGFLLAYLLNHDLEVIGA